MAKQNILFPTGRYIGGHLYKGRTQDEKGAPLVYKSGANKGQPRTEFVVAYAIPKGPERSWFETVWGQQILAVAAAAHPTMYQNPAYSWKIKDGDSAVPNKRNKRPCDMEGAPGHWLIYFGGSFAPKIVDPKGHQDPGLLVEGAIKHGSYIQMYGSVEGNTGESPGVYLNYEIVSFQGYGPEISIGPDATAVGFGQQALPPGASAVPVGGMSLAQAAVQAAPAVPTPAVPGSPAAMMLPAVPAAPQLPVAPNPAFLQPPQVPAAPVVPQVPVVPAGPQMTAKAGGVSYADFIAKGWTDELLRSNGFMV